MNYYDNLSSNSINWIKYVNNKLEIDYNDSEKNIDEQTIEKLTELWNELDEKSYDKYFFDYTNQNERKYFLQSIKKVLDNDDLELFKSNELFKGEDINKFREILFKYIKEIKKIDYPDNLILNNDKSILMTFVWIAMGIWWQSLTTNIEYTSSLCFICLAYIYVDHYFDDITIQKKNKKQFAEYCYKRLFTQIEPYDVFTNKINKIMKMMEENYSKEKYLLTYNRLVYLYSIEMKSMKIQTKISLSEHDFLQLTIEKGYSTLDTVLYLIYINNSEEIDQHKQNFFSLFGLYIQMVDDLVDLKNDIKHKNYTYLCKIYLSKSLKTIDFYVNKINNLIKIMYHYLKNSNVINSEKELTLKRFKVFSINILAYGVIKNKEIVSPEIYEHYKNIYILDKNDISNLKSSFILKLKSLFI
jgi:hypothetical protein